MEPAEQSSIAVPPLMLEEREIHLLARCIKQYVVAAQKNTSPDFFSYFGNAVLLMGEAYSLATQVINSERQDKFRPATCDGTNWPSYWPKDSGALIEDLESFTAAAVALLKSRQPAGSVDPRLLAQPENGL